MDTTWTHVLDGMAVLGHWQTYVAALEFLIVCLLMPLAAGFLFARRPDAQAGSGCLMLVMVPVLEVWAMVVFVMTLSPILLGVSSDADWMLPFRAWAGSGSQMSALLGGLTLLALVMNVAPLLQRRWALHGFVLGSIILAFSVDLVAPGSGEVGASRQIDYLPSLLPALVMLVMAALASVVDELLLVVVYALFGEPDGPTRHLIVSPVAALPGFVPVFVYGAWLGAQL